jgi:penicillin-binding protein 1A
MLHAGMLIMDPANGKIRVWIGGNHFRYLPYDLVLANRMIASAFKPVIYATALEEGYQPCDYFDNEIKTYEEYDNWRPSNYDGTSGDEVAMWYALARSLNLPTVDLLFRIGFKRVEEMCFRMGIEQIPDNSPSIALGAIDLSLWDMVQVYSSFANAGRKTAPVMIERISDSNGQILYEIKNMESNYVIDPEITYSLTSMLKNAINLGTGSSLRSQFKITSELAGKTGTSQNYSDAWFFAYNPGMVCGIWVGARDPQVHFSTGDHGSGSSLALPIAGYLINGIERESSLKKVYLKKFKIPATYQDQMACEGVRTKGSLNRFFENIFGKKEKNDTARKEESKVKKFFKKLFRKVE